MGSHAVSSNIGRAQGWRCHLDTQPPSLIKHHRYVAWTHRQLFVDLLLRQYLYANSLVLKTCTRARCLDDYLLDLLRRVASRRGNTHSIEDRCDQCQYSEPSMPWLRLCISRFHAL